MVALLAARPASNSLCCSRSLILAAASRCCASAANGWFPIWRSVRHVVLPRGRRHEPSRRQRRETPPTLTGRRGIGRIPRQRLFRTWKVGFFHNAVIFDSSCLGHGCRGHRGYGALSACSSTRRRSRPRPRHPPRARAPRHRRPTPRRPPRRPRVPAATTRSRRRSRPVRPWDRPAGQRHHRRRLTRRRL